MARRSPTPPGRIRILNAEPPRRSGKFVLYWMTAARRTGWNYALDRAVALARELDRPLAVLEGMRCGAGFSCDRSHAFVLQGMAENERAFLRAGVAYHPYVEPTPGAGRGLLAALTDQACAVITDDFPHHFLPRMLAAAADRLPGRLEAVDSNGLLPIRAPNRAFSRAVDLRRFLQRDLRHHLEAPPRRNPLARANLRPLRNVPRAVREGWPRADAELLTGSAARLAELPIDHEVGPVALPGGTTAARRALRRFLDERLARYSDASRHPDEVGTSGLSPYLHFGHLSAHEVFAGIVAREDWTPARLAGEARGQREGWWGMSSAAESFLDELVTWRELCLNTSTYVDGHDRWDSLPLWARETLLDHAGDARPYLYDRETFEAAATHDPLWNAAQRELRETGTIHGYLRMLWGKKILHWSASPREALELTAQLNDRWALDGRDPNSTGGVFWIYGRYDRAWGPERPVFGKVRYMSGTNTRRKLRLRAYLERWEDVVAQTRHAPCTESLRG